MYETIKVVKGHEIYRMIGTRGYYHVRVDEYRTIDFRTIKAAVEFINNKF